MAIAEILKNKKWATTAELGPPKGTNLEPFFKQAAYLKNKVHAVNVTDQQSAWILAQDRAGCAPCAHGCEPLDHPLIVTEQSYGAGQNRRARRIARALERLGPNPTDDQLRKVLSMHDRAHPFDAACVHTEHRGRPYGTRSSTIIRMTPTSFRYLHAEGPPCTTPYEIVAEGTFEDWRMGRLGKIVPMRI